MKRLYVKLLIALMLPLKSFCQNERLDTIKVFFLGGQSNMAGFGKSIDLPVSSNSEINSIWIFHGNAAKDNRKNGGLGKWEILKPGHGSLFQSNADTNILSGLFGAELSFGMEMKSFYPNEKIALIKYAKGGSSLDRKAIVSKVAGTWDPKYKRGKGINQYTHFLKTVSNALKEKDINGDGKEDYLVPSGIVWMQGESDAIQLKTALGYKENLKGIMGLIRNTFNSPNLPIVIGLISDSKQHEKRKIWKHGEIIQNAQKEFVIEDKNAILVESTLNYNYSDKYHYDTEGYIDLGKEFAIAILKLLSSPTQK
jgi:hypothetical protein